MYAVVTNLVKEILLELFSFEMEQEIKKNNPRLSSEQLDILISFMEMEANVDLRDGITKTNNLSAEENLDLERRWSEIVKVLNLYGPVKTEKQWIQCWKDQKKNLRRKISIRKGHKTKELTLNDERILSLMNVVTPSVKKSVSTSRKKKSRVTNGTSNVKEPVPVVEERILMKMNDASTVKESVRTNVSNMEVLMIEDALMAEDEEATCPDESNHVEDTKMFPLTELTPGPSLLEADQAKVMPNLGKQSHSETGQAGFLPIGLNSLEAGKQEENQLPLSAILENLKMQNDLLKRIVVVNEQIAHRCLTVACNSEKWRKENSLPTDLIRDLNHKLNSILKQSK